MADNDDEPTRRQSHFNEQRASLRSDTSASSSNPRSRSRHESLRSYRHGLPRNTEDFDLLPDRADSETLPSRVSSPAPTPDVPRIRSETRASREQEKRRSKQSSAGRDSASSRSKLRTGGASTGRNARDRLRVALWEELDFLTSPPPDLPRFSISGFHYERAIPESDERSSSNLAQASRLAGPRTPTKSRSNSDSPQHQAEITALPVMTDAAHQQLSEADRYHQSFASPGAQRTSRLLTELYTISFLVFFAIWGTLARLGLQALTSYPGAPVVFSELWANVAGTFVMGFLAEDTRLFREEWGNASSGVAASEAPRDRPAEEEGRQEPEKQRVVDRKSHGKVKKTIPLYIGLTTGFCGSFTSFSSFARDVFLALSNDLPAPPYHRAPPAAAASPAPRAAGYSIMAVLGVVFTTVALCLCALKAGAHLAASMSGVTPMLSFRRTRKLFDPLVVPLALAAWLAAALLAALPPHNAWRGQALFACVFAPLGCLARYYASLLLNPRNPSFPLGTFACNIFGTAVLGMAYNLQRVAIGGVAGGGVVGCQVLQGIEDGFCGALTTVSTWMVELEALRRGRAYVYGASSVVVGVSVAVVVMGGVRWSVGWEGVVCAA